MKTRTLLVSGLVLAVVMGVLLVAPLRGADMPAAGAAAPGVTLTSNEGKPVNLSDYKGKWVVLYFYPKDFTGGCTLEAHNFQADLAKYEQAAALILRVSVDTAE